jgi:hypothetical protein
MHIPGDIGEAGIALMQHSWCRLFPYLCRESLLIQVITAPAIVLPLTEDLITMDIMATAIVTGPITAVANAGNPVIAGMPTTMDITMVTVTMARVIVTTTVDKFVCALNDRKGPQRLLRPFLLPPLHQQILLLTFCCIKTAPFAKRQLSAYKCTVKRCVKFLQACLPPHLCVNKNKRPCSQEEIKQRRSS